METLTSTPRDPYRVAGIPRDATKDEARAAFLQLVREYHPDLHPDDPEAGMRFREIVGAFRIVEKALDEGQKRRSRKHKTSGRQRAERPREAPVHRRTSHRRRGGQGDERPNLFLGVVVALGVAGVALAMIIALSAAG